MRYRFGGFELDVEKHELRRDGEIVAIEPQVFRLLVHLVSEHNRVVTKDELIEVIWDGRFVSDSAISSRVKSARQALGDSGKTQSHIKTIHGQGFRFVADVEAHTEPELQAAPASAATSAASPVTADDAAPRHSAGDLWPSRVSIAIAALVGLVLAVLWLRPQASHAASDLLRLAILPVENATGEEEHEWAEMGLMSLLIQTLHQDVGVQTVSDRAAAAVSEPYVLYVDDEFVLPAALKSNLIDTRGASHFVLSRLTRQGDGFVLDFVLQDRQGAERHGRVEADELSVLAAKASRSITEALPASLRLKHDSEVDRDPFVAEAYARGRAFQIEGKAEQARNLFGVAAEQAPDDAWLRYEYALCTRMMGELDEAEAQLNALQEEATQMDDTELLVAILNARSIIHMNRRETDAAIILLEQALPLSQDVGDRADTATILINLGIQSRRKGDLDQADIQLMRALSEYDAAGIKTPPGALLNSIALVRAEQGDRLSAIEYLERARVRFELDGADRHVGSVHQNISDIQQELGVFDEALAQIDKSLAVRRALGDERAIASSLGSKALLMIEIGRLDEAETLGRELLSLATDLDNPLRQAMAHAILGTVYFHRGDGAFAVQHHRRELTIGDAAGRETLIQSATLLLARAQHLSGDKDLAVANVHDVISWAQAEPSPRHEAEAVERLGDFDADVGNWSLARQHYALAASLVAESSRFKIRGRIAGKLGRACFEAGDLTCARAAFDEARTQRPGSRATLMLEAALAQHDGQLQNAVQLYRRVRETFGEHWSDADAATLAALERR